MFGWIITSVKRNGINVFNRGSIFEFKIMIIRNKN